MKPIRCINSNDQLGNFRYDSYYLLYFERGRKFIYCTWKRGVFDSICDGYSSSDTRFLDGMKVRPYNHIGGYRPINVSTYIAFEMTEDEYLNHIVAEAL